MWQIKTFTTKEAFDRWLQTKSHRYKWVSLGVATGYKVQYRKKD